MQHLAWFHFYPLREGLTVKRQVRRASANVHDKSRSYCTTDTQVLPAMTPFLPLLLVC